MKGLTFSILFTSLLITTNTFAQTKQILRLETGMHILPVKKIATDAAGKYLLTCSDDKTARLWNAANGTLLKIFRIPLNVKTGKLCACSISPDGKTIALGGETDYQIKGSYSIYILDAQTAEIKYNIKGLPETINDLEFSPNGKWLAAGLWGENGVRIYDTEKWGLKKNLQDYKGNVFSMCFNPAGNEFATVSFDGMLRLYDNDFNLIKDADCDIDKEPVSIAYDRTGTLLTIGYNQSAAIEVRDAKSLTVLYNPSVAEAEGDMGKIQQPCFSKTNDILFGAGSFHEYDAVIEKEKTKIRIWEKNGKEKFTDKPLFFGSIADIKPLPGNRIAVAGDYPEIAVLNDSGTVLWHRLADKINYDIGDAHFKINEAGNEIALESWNRAPFTFNVANRSISFEYLNNNLQAPSYSRNGTIVTKCNGGIDEPSINDSSLWYAFDKYERCGHADISDDGQNVCIGTNRMLRLFTRNAKSLWKIPMRGFIQAVNISGNGKLVAVAFDDGIVKWYNINDGKEMLALFLHADKKQWILFTPDGYYDASPGAENFLGWQEDNGPDKEPSFYPMPGFKKEYFRPDIISKALSIP